MPDHGNLEPSQQLIAVLNKIGNSTEHLARSIDQTLLFLIDASKRGTDPLGFVDRMSSTVGKVADAIRGSGQKRRR